MATLRNFCNFSVTHPYRWKTSLSLLNLSTKIYEAIFFFAAAQMFDFIPPMTSFVLNSTSTDHWNEKTGTQLSLHASMLMKLDGYCRRKSTMDSQTSCVQRQSLRLFVCVDILKICLQYPSCLIRIVNFHSVHMKKTSKSISKPITSSNATFSTHQVHIHICDLLCYHRFARM
jgi:hypothetical protein